MSTPNRTALLNKTHRVLKRTYPTTPARGEHPLLETLLFACCLENAPHTAAHQALEKLRGSFFDWNEIRVSTVKELSEVLEPLPDAAGAAARLKNVLQAVFESDYSFCLEHLKKQNIGVAVKRLQKLPGATPFGVAYATQMSLGGHAIPLDKGTLGAMAVIGVISPQEAQSGNITGLERAIPKSKGREYGALFHELGAEFFANPYAPSLKELLLSIAPDAKDRLPKRTTKKPAPAPAPAPPPPAPPKAVEKKKVKEVVAPAKKVPVPSPKKRPTRTSKTIAPTKKKVAVRPKKASTKTLPRRKPR
ncbi:MAG: hypothetical protein AB7O59_15925 [Pirellulales bacterium]